MDIETAVQCYIKTKDEKFYSIIYNKLQPLLLPFIKKYVHDNDTAHEILSNTNERIFIALNSGKYEKQDSVKFTTWAYSCALNAVRYYIRYYNKTYQQETSTINESFVLNDLDPLGEYKGKMYKEIVYFINNELTEDDNLRKIAQMFYIENEKQRHIAEELGYNINNVKYRIMKIKDVIRNNIQWDPLDY